MLTQERLKELLNYDPDTGVFTRLISLSSRSKVGSVAGFFDSEGYREMRVSGQRCKAHRLAWFYVHGYWPKYQIDHINGIKDDNRLSNLRESTHSENAMNRGVQKNNTSGYKGVSYVKKIMKWQAVIKINKKQKFIGHFDTPYLAHLAYKEASEKTHGTFSRLA